MRGIAAVIVACFMVLLLSAWAAESPPAKKAFDLTNTVCKVLFPALDEATEAKNELRQKGSTPARLEQLASLAHALQRVLQEQLKPEAEAGNKRAQFYYARGLLSLAEFDEVLGKPASGLREESKSLFKASAERGHPGAAEMVAQLSDDPSEMRKWRFAAAEKGCLTSFWAIKQRGDYGELISGPSQSTFYFKDTEEAYYFTFLHLLVESHWHSSFVIQDMPYFSSGVYLRTFLSAPKAENNKWTLTKVTKCEGRAGRAFVEMDKNYLLGEVDLSEWRR